MCSALLSALFEVVVVVVVVAVVDVVDDVDALQHWNHHKTLHSAVLTRTDDVVATMTSATTATGNDTVTV